LTGSSGVMLALPGADKVWVQMHLFRHNTTVRDKHDNLVDPSVVQMLTNIHDIRQNTRQKFKAKRLITHQTC